MLVTLKIFLCTFSYKVFHASFTQGCKDAKIKSSVQTFKIRDKDIKTSKNYTRMYNIGLHKLKLLKS